jgi:hypothetical protein
MTTKAARVEAALLAVLARHAADPDGLPTTGRFLFYELEQQGDATKPDPSDSRPNRRRSEGWPPGAQDVTDALTRLRKDGRVAWQAIADTERSLLVWEHAPTVAEYVHERLDEARINPWAGPPPLILTESNGMAQVLRRVAAEHLCPIGGSKGMTTGWLRTVVVPMLTASGARTVLYLGDLDTPGLQIEANSRRVLEGTLGETLDWRRIGILPEQTVGMTPITKRDGRTGITSQGWEVEALGQSAVVALVRDTLTALLPQPLSHVHERESVERERVRELLRDA